VAVLDRGGRIIAVNESWTRFTRECDLERPFAVGASYLEGWQGLRAAGAPEAVEILAGVADVLERAREGFTLDYPCHVLGGERWFTLMIVPLKRGEGGVVVSHTEITERRRAEMEAQTSRQELAHFLRVSTMGLLTTSLAHELNQPLTAILANAQAARRLLKSATPDIQELGEIVSDMIAEDERAAGVIRRLRGLLKKGETYWGRQDLNWLLREVIRLLRNDSLIRKVAVRLELDGGSLPVDCDSIQIQQVVLNLLLNAMDAVGGSAPEHRSVVVRSGRLDARTVQVSIEDSGVGLQDGSESRVFEPFYSTKPDGMGMGLSIARSIIQAHGGAIWARNNPSRGASFGFALPLAP
jgi:C4-dicarboxylate-specific signal transduction histidine kinase